MHNFYVDFFILIAQILTLRGRGLPFLAFLLKFLGNFDDVPDNKKRIPEVASLRQAVMWDLGIATTVVIVHCVFH